MAELKPCPFCGGKAQFRSRSFDVRANDRGWVFDIFCTKCCVELPRNYRIDLEFNDCGEIQILSDGRQAAIEEWNRRVNDA